jgi:hypothetical protein
MFQTNIPGWDEMTPLERLTYASTVQKCDVHDYEPMINFVGKESVMQICKNCLDMQAWIYNWED